MCQHFLPFCNDVKIDLLTSGTVFGVIGLQNYAIAICGWRNFVKLTFERRLELIAGAIFVVVDRVGQILFVLEFWEEFLQRGCQQDFFLIHNQCKNFLLLLGQQIGKIEHDRFLGLHDDCMVIFGGSES